KRFPKDAVKEFNRGGESQRKGKLDEAAKHYLRCIALAADFFPAHNDLGTIYLQKADFPSARKEFEEVVKANPNDASAYFNLANVSLLSQQFQEGLDYVNRGLAKEPNSGTGLFIQGSLYRHLGRMPEAERSLRNSLQADPTLANAGAGKRSRDGNEPQPASHRARALAGSSRLPALTGRSDDNR